MNGFERMKKAVLELPVQQRVWLAESLVASLAPVAEDLAEAAEIAEAERRESEIASGRRQPLDEFQRLVTVFAEHPRRFHPVSRGFRQTNLRRFSCHFSCRDLPDGIRGTLVKHHRRDPDYGPARE